MATKSVLDDSVVAGGDLSGKQFYAVSLQTDDTVELFDTDTELVYGILQNNPKSGETAEIMLVGRTKVEFGETVAVGNQIRSDNGNGKIYIWASDTDRTLFSFGICTKGGAAGEIGEAMISTPSQDRGESA